MILIEFKSRGKNLDKAHKQAKDYFPGIADKDLPKYILVCDFQKFRQYDLEEDLTVEFNLSELVNNVQHFGYLFGYQRKIYKEQDSVNIRSKFISSASCFVCLPKTRRFLINSSFRIDKVLDK